jgi:hypothetical protein
MEPPDGREIFRRFLYTLLFLFYDSKAVWNGTVSWSVCAWMETDRKVADSITESIFAMDRFRLPVQVVE